MIIEHIKAADLKTNNWSGGTTTQLVIYPKDSDYKKQNFLFRLSTARVECEESTFTKLCGISRKLMILDGEIKIEHKNHHSKTLKKFEQDSFEGDWNTKSYGKAVDFNLMTKGNTKGKIESLVIKNKKKISINSDFNFYGLYVYSGEIKILVNSKEIRLLKGDFLSINCGKTKNEIEITTDNLTEIILTQIRFN
ncbi:MAG: HutD family protein [Bacteroidales bacterium]|nr:HutD family protein [Bacteroidales bacterium]